MSESSALRKLRRLGELCELNPRDDPPADPMTSVSFIPMPAVSEVSGTIVAHAAKPFSEVSKGYTRFRTGDVIFAKITPCMENGKVAIAADLTNDRACGSTEFYVIRPGNDILPEYLWQFLRQGSFRQQAEMHMTGAVGQRRVPAHFLRNAEIPTPPVHEQRRIIAKLDSLFARSRAARQELGCIPKLIERYKQAVLAAAFRGGWPECKLLDLCDQDRMISYGVIKLGSAHANGVPCLRTSNVRWLHFELDGVKSIAPSLSAEYARTILRGGEVLVNVRGTLGGVAVVESNMAGWNVSREVAVVPVDNRSVDPYYIAYWIGSNAGQGWLTRVEKGVAYTGINLEDLRKLPVLVPPLQKQREIVSLIRNAFNRIDSVAAETFRASALLNRLDQATLDQAFRGDLLAIDTN